MRGASTAWLQGKLSVNFAILTGIVGGVFLLYWKSVGYPLVFDDATSLAAAGEYVKRFNNISSLLWAFLTTPDRHLTYLTFDWIGSLGLFWQRIFNILLHSVNSLLVYFVINEIFSHRRTALFTCLFFAFNPCAVHAVAYLTQRSALLVFFFGSIQILFYLKALKSIGSKSFFLFAFSVLAFFFAKFSKEQGAVLAMVYPILGLAFPSWRALAYNMVVVPPAAYFLIHKAISMHASQFIDQSENTRMVMRACGMDENNIFQSSITTQLRLFPKYFLHWLFPLEKSVDMREPITSGWAQTIPFFFISAAGTVLIFLKKWRVLGAGILLSVSMFLTEFGISRIGEVFVLYRAYIFSLGFLFILAFFANNFFMFFRSTGQLLFAAVPVMAFFAGLDLRFYKSNSVMWERAAETINKDAICQGARIYDNAGASLLNEMSEVKDPLFNIFKSINLFKKSLEIHPLTSATNLGVAYQIIGVDMEAEKLFRKTIEKDYSVDRIVSALLGLMQINLKYGRISDAKKNLEKMIELSPNYSGIPEAERIMAHFQ